jgi:predicted  nucleic acid-binding Zn-ribbon protein
MEAICRDGQHRYLHGAPTCGCGKSQNLHVEHQRLQSAVVEAAKEATLDAKHASVEIPVLPNSLQDAVVALIAFEDEHKMGG